MSYKQRLRGVHCDIMMDAADDGFSNRPIQLAKTDPNDPSKFIWNAELIKTIFYNDAIANLPVCLILYTIGIVYFPKIYI